MKHDFRLFHCNGSGIDIWAGVKNREASLHYFTPSTIGEKYLFSPQVF